MRISGTSYWGDNLFTVEYAPPTISAISPSSAIQGDTLTGVHISGNNFRSPNSNVTAQVKNGSSTITGTVTGVTSTQITCNFTIPSGATVGAWDVYVKHNDDLKDATKAGAFTVNQKTNPPPTLSEFIPDSAYQGDTLDDAYITGTNFRGPASNITVQLQKGSSTIVGTGVQVWSSTDITADFNIPADAAIGSWDLYLKHNDDLRDATKTGVLTVGYRPPMLMDISPAHSNQGESLTGVAITGENFRGSPRTLPSSSRTARQPSTVP